MDEKYSTSNVGFCERAGHTGSVEILWEGDTVVGLKCGFSLGDYRTCKFADACELYLQNPVGSVKTKPIKENSET